MFGRRNKRTTDAALSVADLKVSRGLTTRISDLEPRAEVEILGEVEHIVTVDFDGVPSFEISVNDGTGSIVVLWTGRPFIRCIEPGRRLALYGRAAPMKLEDILVVYNPRYELIA